MTLNHIDPNSPVDDTPPPEGEDTGHGTPPVKPPTKP